MAEPASRWWKSTRCNSRGALDRRYRWRDDRCVVPMKARNGVSRTSLRARPRPGRQWRAQRDFGHEENGRGRYYGDLGALSSMKLPKIFSARALLAFTNSALALAVS